MNYILLSAGAGLIALVFAALLVVMKINTVVVKHDRMNEIAKYIHEGAMAFLKREYRVLVVFAIVLTVAIAVGLNSIGTAVSFVVGALFSVLAGFFGMQVATKANVRTAMQLKKVV